ncbi:MAG: flagellar export protein FliJ [Pirellulales bacterium]
MAKFQFRLQTVLVLRTRERDRAAQSVQQAESAKQKLLDQIDIVEEERRRLNESRITGSIGAIDVNRLLDSQRYEGTLLEQVLGLRNNIALIEQEIGKRRLRLVEAEKGVKVLERLAEQQKAAWTEAEFKRQQDVLDEWASFRHYADS